MAAKHGFLPEFVPGTEEWGSYVERAEHYFVANGVDTQATRRAVLLSSCGAPTYRLIRNLSTPLKPGEKTYKEIVELVASHLQPKPSVIMQRFKFNSRVRGEGESIADFVAVLRQLSEHCAFGDTLQDVLRDRLVCGVKDERIQRRLLGEVELTFARAFQIALAVESANKHAIELQSSVPTTVPPVINAVGSRPKDKAKKVIECYRCGGNHYASSCRFKGAICSQCGKRGHLAKVCRGVTHKREDAVEKTHRINDEENEEEVLQTLNVLGLPKVQPFIVPMEINGARIDMELDTGAAMTVISKRMFEDLWGSCEKGMPTLHPTATRLSTYTGEPLSIAGVAEVVVSYKSQTASLPLLVVNSKGPNLLGRNWLQVIKIDWGEIHNVRVNKNLEELLEKHRVLFQDELGTLKGVFAKFSVDPLVSPRFYKARSVPYVLKDKIEVELRRLETSGVIRPVPFADWAAPIVPIVKEDGTVRICGDYKLTVNQASKLESYPVPRVEDLFASLSGGRLFSKISILHPDLAVRVESRQAAQKQDHDTRGISERKFVEGDLVYVRDFRFPKKWIPGVIVTVTGPLSYTVKIGSGVVRRHIDHLRARHNSQVDASDDVYVDNPNDITSGPSSAPVVSPSSSDERAVPTADSSSSEPCVQAPPEIPPSIPPAVGIPVASAEDNDIPQPQVPISAPVRRSTRVRKPPDYYGY